ncbi:mas-related G-protein coupled receptor member H-like isoform X2 [Ambystoma mexicanum]
MLELGNLTHNTTTSGGNWTESEHKEALPIKINMFLLILAMLICLWGMVGNAAVICTLSFKMKRNSCTVYILNLAVADFIFVVGSFVNLVHFICTVLGVEVAEVDSDNLILVTRLMYDFGFHASCLLLMAISVERCVCVLFVMQYQRYRPKHLSGVMCSFFWLLSCLVTGLEHFACSSKKACNSVFIFTANVYLVLTLLLVTSSLILLIEIGKNSKQCRPLRLYVVIIGTCLIFLLSVLPARLLRYLFFFEVTGSPVFVVYFFHITVICNSIHCSTNPLIYILAGRWRKRRHTCSIRHALEKVFNEGTELK